VEFLVIWSAFAIACYFVAKSKNRNPAVWAVAGLLFGFFALLIVALMPKNQLPNNPYYGQPGYGQPSGYVAPPAYSPQPGYALPQQSYAPQPTPPPSTVNSAPQMVPPPIHPQHLIAQQASNPPQSEQQRVAGSVSVELSRLTALHRSGQLSDSDFEVAKRRLLGQ